MDVLILNMFELVSGLDVNYSKSGIVGINLISMPPFLVVLLWVDLLIT